MKYVDTLEKMKQQVIKKLLEGENAYNCLDNENKTYKEKRLIYKINNTWLYF